MVNRLKLKALHRFSTTAAAVEDLSAVQEGKLSKTLKQFLTTEVIEKGKGKEVLAVADSKLGRSISISVQWYAQISANRQCYREETWNKDLF